MPTDPTIMTLFRHTPVLFLLSSLLPLLTVYDFPSAAAQIQDGSSILAIEIEYENGGRYFGIPVVLSDGQNVTVTGLPGNFTLSKGQQYNLTALDYDSEIQEDSGGPTYTFDHWKDTNSTDRRRMISIDSDTELVAVYSYNGYFNGCDGCIHFYMTQNSNVTVNAVDGHGKPIEIEGIVYQNLSSSNSRELQTFKVTTPVRAGSLHFSHWNETGIVSNEIVVAIKPSDYRAVKVYLTAVYDECTAPPKSVNYLDEVSPNGCVELQVAAKSSIYLLASYIVPSFIISKGTLRFLEFLL